MATSLQNAIDAANVASAKASDSGVIVFSQHTGWKQALLDNAAAQKAWQFVYTAAAALPDAGIMSDAQARIGELKVAQQAITADLDLHTPNVVAAALVAKQHADATAALAKDAATAKEAAGGSWTSFLVDDQTGSPTTVGWAALGIGLLGLTKLLRIW